MKTHEIETCSNALRNIFRTFPITSSFHTKIWIMNLVEVIQSQLSDDMLESLSEKVGGSRAQTEAVANGAISTLVQALSKNTQRPGGIESLVSAIDRDHDGSVLDDAKGFVVGHKQPQNAKALNGAGIVRHVLGGRQDSVNDMLSNLTGMEKGKVSQLLITIAPMVMAALGKARHQENKSASGIQELLSHTVKSETNQRNEMGLLGKFLDQDDDGSVINDLMNIGMKALMRRK
jgi:hypothetical protein